VGNKVLNSSGVIERAERRMPLPEPKAGTADEITIVGGPISTATP
jgi:hypothetical protein